VWHAAANIKNIKSIKILILFTNRLKSFLEDYKFKQPI